MYLKDNYKVLEEEMVISGVPVIRMIPEGLEGPLKTIIFYHGLGSKKENQRYRGHVLSSFGFQVIVPDALHHGERDAKDTEDPVEIRKYFWQAIINSTKESSQLIDKIISDLRGDEDYIYVSGHSMGGFTSAGVITHEDRVRCAIPINGSFNWGRSNEMLRETLGSSIDVIEEEEPRIKELDPSNNLEKIKDENILILHGDKDLSVDIEIQRDFYKTMKDMDAKNIKMIEYEGLGHFTTTNMMEDIIKYLKE